VLWLPLVVSIDRKSSIPLLFCGTRHGSWKYGVEWLKVVLLPIFKQLGHGCMYLHKKDFQQVSNAFSDHVWIVGMVGND
jgi:hypothetical protein